MVRRFIIDTDTAGDDIISILLALKWPDIKVDALTIVAGNVEFSREVKNALYVVENFSSYPVPVYPGARTPLLKDWTYADYVHGKDGMSDQGFPDPKLKPEEKHGALALVELVDKRPGEYTIIAQGPLTNIALATMIDPDFPKKVGKLYIMGGYAIGYGNITPIAEYNFWVDPDAAKLVFKRFAPINKPTVVGWDITLQSSLVYKEEHEEILGWGTKEAEFFVAINRKPMEFEFKTFGINASTHPDTLTTAIAINPKVALDVREKFVDIEEREGPTRGAFIVDHDNVLGKTPNARIVYKADGTLFKKMLFSVLRGRPGELE